MLYYFKGGAELVTKLKSDPSLASEKNAVQGLDAINLLFQYSEVLGIVDKVCLNLLWLVIVCHQCI